MNWILSYFVILRNIINVNGPYPIILIAWTTTFVNKKIIRRCQVHEIFDIPLAKIIHKPQSVVNICCWNQWAWNLMEWLSTQESQVSVHTTIALHFFTNFLNFFYYSLNTFLFCNAKLNNIFPFLCENFMVALLFAVNFFLENPHPLRFDQHKICKLYQEEDLWQL